MHTVLYPVNLLGFGGAEQQLLSLVRGLDKSRFHPIVAPLYPGFHLEREIRQVPDVELVNLNRHGKLDPSPLWKLGRLARARGVDIVQPFLTPATFFGLLPALLVGVPIKIVTERAGSRVASSLGNRSYVAVEDWLARFADVVVPNSGAGRDMLLQRGIPSDKIHMIYNGVNPERLSADPSAVKAIRAHLGASIGEPVIGILASLTPQKDHATFLWAAAQVAGAWPKLRLAIVGEGELRDDLEALAAELGLSDRTTFFGYQAQVADYLLACDLVVSSSCDLEGCSNSILEAMALGLPVIATDIGGNRELIEDAITGYLVPTQDPSALAGAIERALRYPSTTVQMAARGRAGAETRFGMARMVAEYEDLYSRLLDAKATPRRATNAGSAARSGVEMLVGRQ